MVDFAPPGGKVQKCGLLPNLLEVGSSDLVALSRDVVDLIDRAENGEQAMRIEAWNLKMQSCAAARRNLVLVREQAPFDAEGLSPR